MNAGRSKSLLVALALAPVLFCACKGGHDETPAQSGAPSETSEAALMLKNVTAVEAAELLASNKDVVVLDIRTPEEFAEGHIAGAVNIDYRDPAFERNLETLDKSKSYLMHCRSGGRSGRALPVFEQLKFESLYHLKGGILDWKGAGKPLATE